MNEILNFFIRITGDGYLAIALPTATAYIFVIVFRKWLVAFSEKRGLNTGEIKKLLVDVGIIAASLVLLVFVVNILKGTNLSAPMTRKISIGAFMSFFTFLIVKETRDRGSSKGVFTRAVVGFMMSPLLGKVENKKALDGEKSDSEVNTTIGDPSIANNLGNQGEQKSGVTQPNLSGNSTSLSDRSRSSRSNEQRYGETHPKSSQ